MTNFLILHNGVYLHDHEGKLRTFQDIPLALEFIQQTEPVTQLFACDCDSWGVWLDDLSVAPKFIIKKM